MASGRQPEICAFSRAVSLRRVVMVQPHSAMLDLDLGNPASAPHRNKFSASCDKQGTLTTRRPARLLSLTKDLILDGVGDGTRRAEHMESGLL